MTDTRFEESIAETAVEGTDASPGYAVGGDVRADRVEISQGGANLVEARSVSIQQGGAGRVRATDVTVSQGGIGLAQADRIEIGEGGGAMAVLAGQATVQPGGRVLLLLARSSSGEVRPLIDPRAAAAIGAGLVLAALLLRGRR